VCGVIDAEVARKLARQQQGSEARMWAQLGQLWDAASRMAAKEKAAGKMTPNGGEMPQP